jgi:hypothetical protein
MRKSKITLGIVAGLLSTFALAACDGPTFSGDGYVLTYTGANGQEYHYTAEELFDSYLQTTSGASSLFDSVYKVLVRNYFITDDTEAEVLTLIQILRKVPTTTSQASNRRRNQPPTTTVRNMTMSSRNNSILMASKMKTNCGSILPISA